MATTPTPSSFSGSDNENPQNFLREVERYIHLNRITDEVTKVIIFGTFISAGSQADIWWDALTAAQMASWTTVKVAFQAQWPAIVVAAKSTLEYQKELTLRLKEEDVGEHITVAGVSTWSHLHYHGRLQKLVQDAGVANAPVFIHQVREALPRIIRELTSPAPPDWTTFFDKIKNANIDIIQDKVRRDKERREAEKAQNLRIAKLESKQADPVEVLRLQMQRATIRSADTPSTAAVNTHIRSSTNTNTTRSVLPNPARAQIRYVAANRDAAQRPRTQPPTQDKRDTLRARINELQHNDDTDMGYEAYKEQLKQWTAKWGEGARCMESTPFPLMPGTAQICSGECFRCGMHGHIGPMCPLPTDAQLPKNESIWRSTCTRVLGTFNRAIAPQINFVFDETEDQGKGSGPLA